MRYLLILEKAENNYSAYSPDVPGCVTTGKTIEETKANMLEALTLHLDGLFTDGDEIPEPAALETQACYLEFEWSSTVLAPAESNDPFFDLE